MSLRGIEASGVFDLTPVFPGELDKEGRDVVPGGIGVIPSLSELMGLGHSFAGALRRRRLRRG